MNQTKFNARCMTTLALLMAIVLIMSYTPLGFLQVGAISMSLLAVPVAIAAIVMGPEGGLFTGFLFGITSFMQGFKGSSPMGAALIVVNPIFYFIVTVVSRVLMGVCTGWIAKALSKTSMDLYLRCVLSGLCAALLNTIFFMSTLIIFFYQSDYIQALVSVQQVSNPFMFVIVFVGIQGVIEAVTCAIVSGAVSVPLLKSNIK